MDDALLTRWIVYGLGWFSFGLVHSLLASNHAKQRMRGQMGAHYRLSYNIFATLHLGCIWALGFWMFMDAPDVIENPGYRNIMQVVSIAGFGLLIYAATGYDLGRFSGLTQIRNAEKGLSEPDDEPLKINGLHSYIRHPIYTGAFLMLWGRAYSEQGLATAIFASLYLVIGIFYEERKLLQLYGKAYKDYQQQVPSLIPWKGRALAEKDSAP